MALNDVNSLINQQTGSSKWRDSHASLKRLRCTKNNSYTQLLPHEDLFYRDTPIFTCKFSQLKNAEHILALANEDGKLALHNSNTGTRSGIHAHNNAIFDLAWMFDQMKLITASGDHSSKLYDVGDGDIKLERVFCGHLGSVKTVAFRKNDTSVFATGGRDGNIILWDTRVDAHSFVGKADRVILNPHHSKTFTPSKLRKKNGTPTQSGIKSVTGLVFQEENTLISCGAGDGVIKIWDIRKNYLTYKKESIPKTIIPYPGNTTKNGYSSLIIDSDGIRLYANCLDNTIYCYNLGTYNTEPIMRYRGHQNSTFYVKSSLGRDGAYLLSGSSDENAYIWDVKHSQPLLKLSGHSAEVTCVAWCNKKHLLVTCSDDMTHKFWTIGPEELPEDWNINGRGKAEILPLEYTLIKGKLKRLNIDDQSEYTPKRILLECRRCTNGTSSKYCENCPNYLKRKHLQEMERELTPRRLFSNVHNLDIEKTDTLATHLDHEPPSKLPRLDEKSSTLSTTEDQESRCEAFPTVNLPNYIVDGTAPHLNYSPPKEKSQDWLTRFRIESQLKRTYEGAEGVSAAKQPRIDVAKPKKSVVEKSPLLKYFKVTNSTQKCDGIACLKLHVDTMVN